MSFSHIDTQSSAILTLFLCQAYASFCQQDQFYRPTFGVVNFCPNKITDSLTNDGLTADTILTDALWTSTTEHEIAHALVFTSNLFPLFRKIDGTPYIAHEENTAVYTAKEAWRQISFSQGGDLTCNSNTPDTCGLCND